MDQLWMPLDAFVRSVGVAAESPHAFFLGAGASISSGVPHAGQCIWEWKRRLFLTNHPGLEDQFAELSLPSVRERIQRWLDSQHYPEVGDPDEYGAYIERCYPIPDDRRRYFQSMIRGTKPSTGYQLLALLAEAGICDSVWTTNFDGLVAKAAAATSMVPVEVGIDSSHRVFRAPNRGELLCVSLHGEYRYDRLKNTVPELRSQDAQLRAALVSRLENTSLIVVGYSGRDESVMAALEDAYRRPGTGSLFWCGYGDADPPPSVQQVLTVARAAGRTAYYVLSAGFDDLVTRLALYNLRGDRLAAARSVVSAGSRAAGPRRSPFVIEPRPTVAVVKGNAIRIEVPSDVLEAAARMPADGCWKWIRGKTEGKPVVAVPFRGKLLAMGTADGLRDAFGSDLTGSVSRTPIVRSELTHEDGAVTCLLRSALVHCLAGRCGLATDGSRELWEPDPYETRRGEGAAWRVHKAVRVSLRALGADTVLTLDPTVHVSDATGATAPHAATKAVRTAVLGYQHNSPFNTDLEFWRKKFIGVPALEFPPDCGSTFRFKLAPTPLYARIGGSPSDRPLALRPDVERSLSQAGLVRPEPQLVFASATKHGTEVRDTYPIRGIARNRPFDFALSRSGLADRVSVGVVCPKLEFRKCEDFLAGLLRTYTEPRGGQEYLLDYPGFQPAFGLPLHLPTPGGEGWALCAEPTASGDDSKDGLELARRIISGVEELRASASPGVVVVFIPSRWRRCRNGIVDGARFDLHDHVKAYCVRRGVATQFVEEETAADAQPYRVYWWLALALYVKTRRTPWLLDSLQPDTAYVGFGMSVDRFADRGQRVLLGCSHIYSARGEGLRYKLSKIDNPIYRRKNAFLTEEDARRVGGTILELYFDASGRLPERVVIHKRTPFGEEEIKGLRDGLGAVKELDLLEINHDPSLLYVASAYDAKTQGLRQDGFPVRRGTAIRLDDFSSLLWSHGSTPAIDGRKTYYQGKRRIPAPLVIRRHLGETPLATVADEVLGLTKMNWNTFDMYTKLPATVATSNEIARIGALLDRFTEASYDYRLFM